MIGDSAITIAPLVPWPLLAAMVALGVLLTAFAAWRRARGTLLRALAITVLAVTLLNPSVSREDRTPIKDVAVVVADRSPSQRFGGRLPRTDRALAALRDRAAAFDDLDLRVVDRAEPVGTEAVPLGETRLFDAVAAALVDVPQSRRAGVILITDGQVHDAPVPSVGTTELGPVHVLLTGSPEEADRRLEIIRAPSYGIVGRPVSLTVRVVDTGDLNETRAVLHIHADGEFDRSQWIDVGRDTVLTLDLPHGGQNIVELRVEAAPRELTLSNNQAAVAINAVRDRLRVLLVSGEPYPGERTWRNLLKADPSVDLVHFTILRPPEKQDGTPIRELSLIAFPIRELFEIKLNDFDLIIFDRYRQRGVLPQIYLDNIVHYVRQGGAFLEASGPTFSSPFSLYRTPLGDILPGRPVGRMIERPYRPFVTQLGQRHPVTAGLVVPWSEAGQATRPTWGRWFRQNDVRALDGMTVMAGAGNRPLLLLDRVGDGRVAQIASDHIWLWSRGFEGGGPHGELLRRLAHWLMQEPELEENDLRASSDGTRIRIERRSLVPVDRPAVIATPSGETLQVDLVDDGAGRATGLVTASEPGLYRITDGEYTAVAVVGALNLPELADVRTTADRVAPVVRTSGGSVTWLAELTSGDAPDLRRTRPDRDQSGRGWIGLRANADYAVRGATNTPLMPVVLVLLLALGTLTAAWVREGR